MDVGTLNDLRQATFSRKVVSKCYVFSPGIYSFNKRNTHKGKKGAGVIGPVTLDLEKVPDRPIGTFTFFSFNPLPSLFTYSHLFFILQFLFLFDIK